MKTAFQYTISISPAGLSEGLLKKLPAGLSDSSEIAVGSIPLKTIGDALKSSFDIIDAVISKTQTPEKVISLIHVNETYKSIMALYSASMFASDKEVEMFELALTPFKPGEIMRIWLFDSTDLNVDADGKLAEGLPTTESIALATYTLLNVADDVKVGNTIH